MSDDRSMAYEAPITIAQLAQKSGKSVRTIHRLVKARKISYRQVRTGSPLEFDWRRVEQELADLETPAAHRPPAESITITRIFAELQEIKQQQAHILNRLPTI